MNPLNQYKQIEDNITHYEDEEGCYYLTLQDFLQSKIIGHCCCGNPDDNLKLIYDMLKINQKYREIRGDKSYSELMQVYEHEQEELKNYVTKNCDKFINFFWYVMNDKEIMTHGGSIPGWIDDENFMDALEIWHDQYNPIP